MTDCTERHPAALRNDLAREGQEGMSKEARMTLEIQRTGPGPLCPDAKQYMVRMRDGVRRVFELVSYPAIANITESVRVGETGRGLDDVQDDRQIDAWLQAEAGDYVHAVGTCRMGQIDAPHSVVDSAGRVIGVEGLRVVDASIMPEVPRANTHLTTVMIAEHIAARMQRGTA